MSQQKRNWREWNECFAGPVDAYPDQHRSLREAQDLTAIVCHDDDFVIANDYTFSLAGQRNHFRREQAHAALGRQRLRVEQRRDGELKHGRYFTIQACARVSPRHRRLRAHHPANMINAGGKSAWMRFF